MKSYENLIESHEATMKLPWNYHELALNHQDTNGSSCSRRDPSSYLEIDEAQMETGGNMQWDCGWKKSGTSW